MKHMTAMLGLLLMFAVCAAHADTVTDWNQTAIEVMKVANVAGNAWSRTLAMVHVAMADAINTVQGRYTRYLATVAPVPGAAAAHHILVQLYPPQKALVEEAYAASLKPIPEGTAKRDGVALGVQVATAILGGCVPGALLPTSACGRVP